MDDKRRFWTMGWRDLFLGLIVIYKGGFVVESDDDVITIKPVSTDQVMAHLLWGWELSAEEIIESPNIRIVTGVEPDGRFFLGEEIAHLERATGPEFSKLSALLKEIKKLRRRQLLLSFPENDGGTWEERWRNWNRLFPDLAFQSPGAMRKAYSYAKKSPRQ